MNTKEKIKNILKALSSNFVTIITVMFALLIANFIGTYLFRVSIIYIPITLTVASILFYLIIKDEIKEKEKRLGLRLCKIVLIVLCSSLINHFLLIVSNGFSNPVRAESFFNLNILFHIMVVLGAIALYSKDEIKEVIEKVYEEPILETLGIIEYEKKPGDVEMCKDLKTGKPVYIPLKDRFLHFLILGATGSGKTSQSVLPMILQDMQNLDCGITVIEPKDDLAEKVYFMAKEYGRDVLYFNPVSEDCPTFNPFHGPEDIVIENMATTFKMLNPDSPQFFQDMNEQLIRYSLTVLKRLMGNKANLIELSRLIQNSGGAGRKMVTAFSRLNADTESMAKENADIASWFLNEYFNEKSKTYEHCSGLRSQVAKITANKYLRRVLNPENGESDIDFIKHLEGNGVIAIATAQGTLGGLGSFLGYFLILNFQSAVFKRPGNEFSRRSHFLYIDEFQTYANPGFGIMLTQGRSYRVSSILATQNRSLMAMGAGKDGKNFVDLVSTNARNIILYPGGDYADAKFYSDQFGEYLTKKISRGTSQSKFNPLYGLQKVSYPNESINVSDEYKPRYSPTDIMYREFGEITFSFMKRNTRQLPGVGKITYIPEELNNRLDAQMLELRNKQAEYIKKLTKDFTPEETEPDVIKDPIPSDDSVIVNIPNQSLNQAQTFKKNIVDKKDVQVEVATTLEPLDVEFSFMSEFEDDLI